MQLISFIKAVVTSETAGVRRRALTHGAYELLVQLKGQQRVRQVSQPLFEDATDDVDVVVVQIGVVHICADARRTLSRHNSSAGV